MQPLNILVDAVEAQAIALAQTTPDCIILLDDARARKIAARLNIKQIGTIGLLLRAKRMRLIEKIKPHIEAFIEKGIYASIITGLLGHHPDAVMADGNGPGKSLVLLS